MATKITIPVEFRDSTQSYKQIISQLQEQLKRVKPGTTLYDTIKQQINDAEKEIKKVDAKLDLGIISKSEMQSVSSFLTRVDALVRRASDSLKTVDISNLIDFSDVELFDGNQLKQVQKYRDEIELLEEQIKKLNSSKVKDVLKNSDKKKFTGGELDSGIVETYQSLSKELSRVEEQVNSTNAEFKQLLTSTIKAKSEIIAFKQANAQDLDTQKVGEVRTAQRILGTSGDALKNVRARLLTELNNVESTWSTGGKDFSERILSYLGLDPTQIASIVSDSFKETKNAIERAFASSGKNKLITTTDLEDTREKISSNAALLKTAELERMEFDFQKDKARVLELGQLRKVLPQLKAKVDLLLSEVTVTDDDGTEVDVFKKYQEVIQVLQKAIAEARKLKLTTGADSDQQDAAMDSNVAGIASGEAAFTAQQEADKFKENLKQAISQWLSAQMIITKIREGIHQAWTDIQGLDKAMTNIAVVTDMSVSDLWSKIDEYMAIAQEYGVTTQGVYEVSQLYYQQGLSTSEVMEATTETLKMARIAGMDYAEAADAMTVAIRAFKMEMSDAQVITDVYSKVAAVTASDSQELAIAMSKTASSAESVGSSFENTTAMLAVMIETTRESAQNLGSALKSIISRYGEMKTGLTVDSEGEAIDYNKVDTALQSIGISIKDAQGQFRDFDEVIFELSKKWDSLDKNTQRYIATIMAGNRQQSRFIALVDNWERLEEVSAAAYDSEDAGLLQYAKTLDSLETKLNALSTSFQQFYMSIVNGDTFKGIIDIITNFINGLNKLGNWQSILNITNLVVSLKTIGSLLVNTFSGPLSEIIAQIRGYAEESVNIWADAGRRAAKANAASFNAQQQGNPPGKTGVGYKNAWGDKADLGNKLTLAASVTSLVASSLGTALAKDNQKLGSIISLTGNTASGASVGASFGPHGMAVGAILGAISGIPAIIKAWDIDEILKNKLEKAEQAFNDAELDRATKREEARNLATTLENLKKLQAARYESEEAEKAFIEASNTAHETYPDLIAEFDAAGNAIIDVTSETCNAEYLLQKARQAAAEASLQAAAAELEINKTKHERAQSEVDKYTDIDNVDHLIDIVSDRFNISDTGKTNSSMSELLKQLGEEENLTTDEFINSYVKEVSALREADWNQYYQEALQATNNDVADAKELADQIYQINLEGDLTALNNALDAYGLIDIEAGQTYLSFVNNLNNANGELDTSINRELASQEAVVYNAINGLKMVKEPFEDAEMWEEISGFYSLFAKSIINNFEYTETDFDNGTLNSIKQLELSNLFNSSYESFLNFYNYLKDGLSLESFNEISVSRDRGMFNPQEYKQKLLDITKGQHEEVVELLFNSYSENFNKSVEKTKTYLSSGTVNWSELYDGAINLNNTIARIPQHYHEEFKQVAKFINAQVDNNVLSKEEGAQLVEDYLELWFSLSSLVSPDKLIEVQDIISSAAADGSLFTIGGKAEVQKALKEIGVTTIDVDSIISTYGVNLTTEYALLGEKLGAGLKTLQTTLEKIGDGLNFEEAEKLAKKMGKDLTEAFTFVEGKWWINDVDTAVQALESEYSGHREKILEQLNKDIEILRSSGKNLTSEQQDRWDTFTSKEFIEEFNIWQKANINNPELAKKDGAGLLEAFLQDQANNLLGAYQLELDWLKEEAARSLEISQRARELSGGEEKVRERQSWDLIKSNGLDGYSANDIAQIEKDLGISKDAFIKNIDGTWNLDHTKLKDIPIDVRNSILASIDAEVQSATDAIENLGKLAASGEDKGAYAEAFSTYAGKMGYEWVEKIIPARIRAAANGSASSERSLKRNIVNELRARGEKISGIDDPKVIEAYNKLIAGSKDGITSNVTRLLELSQKSIKGTLTEEEKFELEDLNLEGKTYAKQLQEIAKNSALDAVKKTQQIIEKAVEIYTAGEASWEEVAPFIETGYKEMLDRVRQSKQGTSVKDVEFLDYAQAIEQSEGYYKNDDLYNIITAAGAEGLTVSEETFYSVFDWDEISNSWVFAAGKGFKDLFGENAPDYIEKAFTSSENRKNLQEAIQAVAIANSFKNLYSDVENTTLEDLSSFYDSIKGEGAFAESGEQQNYINALEQAKAGNDEALLNYLDQLITEAEQLGKITEATLLKTQASNLRFRQKQAQSKSVYDSLPSLGNLMADASLMDGETIYADAFSSLVEESHLSWEEADKIIKEAFEKALEGDESAETRIKSYIRHSSEEPLTDDQVDAIYDQIFANYNDTIDQNVLRYLELLKKESESSLSENETIEKNNLKTQLEAKIPSLNNIILNGGLKILDNLSTYIEEALNIEGTDWSDIENSVQQYAEGIFNQAKLSDLGISTDNIDTINLLSNIIDASGVYGSDLYVWLAEYAEKQNLDFDETLFNEAFDYNEILGGFVVKSSNGLNQLLGSWGDEIYQAFSVGSKQLNLDEALRLDEARISVTETIGKLYTDPINASLGELKDLYETIYGEGTFAKSNQLEEYQTALEDARQGNFELLRNHLHALIAGAKSKGIEIDFTKLNDIIKDGSYSIIQTIIGNIESALAGNLSATDLTDLSEKLNINIQDYAQATIDGYKVSVEGMKRIGAAMMQQYGDTYDVASKMYELFVGEEGIFSGYQDIIDAAKALEDVNGKVTEEYKEQYAFLNKMAKLSLLNEEDPMFNFMDQHSTEGLTKNADNLLSTIDTVKKTFQSLSSGENIDYNSFYNIMDFMYEQLGDWDTFKDRLGITDKAIQELQKNCDITIDSYESFVNAIVSSSDELGQVDPDVLMNLGITMENMTEGMSDSLKKVADQQITFLENIRETLLALKALEELGGINLGGLTFTNDNGEEEQVTLLNYKIAVQKGTSVKDVEAQVDQKLEQIKDKLGINLPEILDDGFDYDSEEEQNLIDNLGKFLSFVENSTSETILDFATSISETGENAGVDWQKIFNDIFSTEGLDLSKYTGELAVENLLVSPQIAKLAGVTVNKETGELTYDGSDSEGLKEQIKALYSSMTGTPVEVDISDQGVITVHAINASVQGILKNSNIQWEFDSQSDGYTTEITLEGENAPTVTVIVDSTTGKITFKDQDGNELTDEDGSLTKAFENQTGLSPTGGVLTGVTTPTSQTDVSSAILEQVTSITEILSSGLEITANEDVTEKIEVIKTSYQGLLEFFSSNPLEIGTAEQKKPTDKTPENDGKTPSEDSSDQTQTLTQIVTLQWENLDGWKPTTPPSQPIDIDYQGKDDWEQSGLTQDVKLNYIGNPPGGSNAKGNINLLKTGAALARGTLMGELGPELYVQDGYYKIAGANGPEFVDLKSDAIVFNHLQTKSLLGKGHTSTTGSPVVSERRSVAFATGNFTGPARASGIQDAIAAINRAIAVWRNIANMTAADLAGGGSGGGGDNSENTLTAVTEELQEWYNLTRQIANIEQEINNLLAERENIDWYNGEEYLKNLREQQKLLNKQIASQETLLDFQRLQLQRQAEHINEHSIWSQFLTIGEDGLLQYRNGNETNGGKGALQQLEELNKMSAKEQIAFLKKIGYSYTTQDGKKLKGTELVEQFFKELQGQIDAYDALYDTVGQTEGALEKIKTDIEDINEQIKENQMDLEKEIYDSIINAWEAEIEQLEKQTDLIKEANDIYIDSLSEALQAEKKLYDENKAISDREQLQRRLSLLRRSGGSASEIADLELELNDMLKDEYFSNQEKAIDSIKEASEKQIEQLNEQIRIQEESLEYQKENGVIWSQVYEVMQLSKEGMLQFMQGKNVDFFSRSSLEQEKMLTEWAHKIGIYVGNKEYEKYVKMGENDVWNNGAIWDNDKLKNYQSTYNRLSEEDKDIIKNQFTSTYASARLEGMDHDEAVNEASSAIERTLKYKQDEQGDEFYSPEDDDEEENKIHHKFDFNGQTYRHFETRADAEKKIDELCEEYRIANKLSKSKAKKLADETKKKIKSGQHISGYKEGGLVNYTGLAMVHGSKSRPESFLNAEQTAQIREGLKESGKNGVLEGIKSALLKLDSSIKAITNISNKTETNSYTIAPGAVVIQVEQLNDEYDIDTLSADIMNRIYTIGNKSTNRGVSRR